MLRHGLLPVLSIFGSTAFAQLSPAITSWVINPGGETGYDNIPSNVLEVAYNTTDAFVGCAGIPGYAIGPWMNNPNVAGDQDWEFRIPLAPQENTGSPVNTPLGHIGLWSNGVTIFNPRDGMSWNMLNVWQQNAFYFEGVSFDECLGHPNQQMEYHTHINPTCLYDDADSSQHSPIIGFAFDGFPIYGAYAYDATDGTGAITRMRSSYQLRSITDRTTLSDGTVLNTPQYGPPIDVTYPLGAYIQDHEFVNGSGHLDAHNGRWCVTPDYPDGTYAYFVTIDPDLQPVYPYVLGPTYYGTLQPGNTGPGSGHNDVPSGVTLYDPYTGTNDGAEEEHFNVFIDPFTRRMELGGLTDGPWTLEVYGATGSLVMHARVRGGSPIAVPLNTLSSGVYVLVASNGVVRTGQRIATSW